MADLVLIIAMFGLVIFGSIVILREVVTSPSNWRAWVGIFIIIPIFVFILIVFFGVGDLPGP